jgi:hypothetical protein
LLLQANVVGWTADQPTSLLLDGLVEGVQLRAAAAWDESSS